MKKTRKDITELTVQDIKDLIVEKYGGSETESTEISFKLKDDSDYDDRYPSYVLDGATVTVSRALK